MFIDMFCHLYPHRFLSSYLKTQVPPNQQHILLSALDWRPNADNAYFSEAEARIRYMDKYDIDMEALTLAVPGIWDTVDGRSALSLARLANDSLAEIVQKNQNRMVGMATLPSMEEGEMLDELDRSIRDLGMRGCLVFSNIMGKPIDSPEFLPFYERMQKYDLPIFIHPTYASYNTWLWDYRLDHMLAWPFDTSLAMARLVFGGVLKQFPNLKVVAHHLGGMIPFYEGRIGSFYELHRELLDVYEPYSETARRNVENPLKYFKLLYGDTIVTGSAAALKCGYEFFGADHMVFATDYPFGPEKGEGWTKMEIKNINGLGVTEEERRKICEGNARRLLKL